MVLSIKLKQGQKKASPFPLRVSPWLCKRQALISSLNPHSLPLFIPIHFACRRRPDPIHLFVPFSIAMFTDFNFTQFFYLYFFGYLVSNFIKVFITLCYQILLVTSSICCLFCLALRDDFLYRPQKSNPKVYKNIYEPYNICNYMQNY